MQLRTMITALAVAVGGWLPVATLANCHNPTELIGLWQEGSGALMVRFGADETAPYLGRLHKVEKRLLDVGYREGYPIMELTEDLRARRLTGRVFYGKWAQRNARGALPSKPLMVELRKDTQSAPNLLFVRIRNGNLWQDRYTMHCIDPRPLP